MKIKKHFGRRYIYETIFSIFDPGKYPAYHKARTETSPEKIREFAYLKTPKKKYDPLSVVTG